MTQDSQSRDPPGTEGSPRPWWSVPTTGVRPGSSAIRDPKQGEILREDLTNKFVATISYETTMQHFPIRRAAGSGHAASEYQLMILQ